MSTALATSEQLHGETSGLLQQAQALTITTAEQYAAAAELGKSTASLRKTVTAFFKPMKDAAKAAHQQVVDEEKKALAPIEQAESLLRGKVTDYRVAEQRKADEKARIEAAEARKRIEEQRIAEAERLAAAGNEKKAEAVLDAPIVVPAQRKVEPSTPAVSGIRMRTLWRWRITDAAAIPREWLVLDEVKVNAFVRANQDKTAIPGIEAYSEATTTF